MKKVHLLLLLPFLASCNNINSSISESYEKLPDINNNESINISLEARNILGLAAVKAFENKDRVSLDASLMFNDEDTNEEIVFQYSYPFDRIAINSAFKFKITLNEEYYTKALEPIYLNCGLGEVDVIVANFTTYEYDKESNIYSVSVTDRLITIKSDYGLYTILLNSGRYAYTPNKGSQEIFSSHKQINDKEIEKDFEPPFYGILVSDGYYDTYYVAFAYNESSLVSYSDFDGSRRYEFESSTIESLNEETIFDIYSITSFEKAYITNQFSYITSDFIAIIIDEKIYSISYDEQTIFVNKKEDESIEEYLSKYSKIKYSYDVIYEGYVPTNVYAYTIEGVE